MAAELLTPGRTGSLWNRWDATVTPIVFKAFYSAGWIDIYTPSQATKNLPFVTSPTPVVTSIFLYLAIILMTILARVTSKNDSKSNGTVKKVDPLWLRGFMLFHNTFLVGLSTYMFLETVRQALLCNYIFWGNLYDEKQVGLARIIYIFYISKIYEFNDTFIMLMKGNLHQVTFLHVYHHVSISFVWWFLAYAYPGGDTYYSCALNSFIHVVMYSYYLLTLIIGKDPKKRAKYLWWGRYLTQMQMIQFVSMSVQAAYCHFFVPTFPRALPIFLFTYMQTLLVLFLNFYIRKHVLKGKLKSS